MPPSLKVDYFPRSEGTDMGRTSKDLLHFEHKKPSTSPLESILLVRKKDSVAHPQKPLPDGKLPKSQSLSFKMPFEL
ncbi:hypothetical protein I3760_06G163800 [Carya illinoinensis]|nr:hypothetical protein I3760_06G163800 [Carya illinoinensis]